MSERRQQPLKLEVSMDFTDFPRSDAEVHTASGILVTIVVLQEGRWVRLSAEDIARAAKLKMAEEGA